MAQTDLMTLEKGDILSFSYTNWEGKTAERLVAVRGLSFGATQWHPAPQFLLDALDIEKYAARGFAIADIDPQSVRKLPRRPLTLIAAVAENRVIGANGDMPWHLPEDLAHFKATTKGHPVIMGRKTYESIVARLGKPLPGRTSIVISQTSAEGLHEGVYTAPSVTDAVTLGQGLAARAGVEQVFVIGGAQIYDALLNVADRMILTEIGRSFEGDAYFPAWRGGPWRETARAVHEAGDLPFAFVTYERNAAGS